TQRVEWSAAYNARKNHECAASNRDGQDQSHESAQAYTERALLCLISRESGSRCSHTCLAAHSNHQRSPATRSHITALKQDTTGLYCSIWTLGNGQGLSCQSRFIHFQSLRTEDPGIGSDAVP